jgi:hypothetical protein
MLNEIPLNEQIESSSVDEPIFASIYLLDCDGPSGSYFGERIYKLKYPLVEEIVGRAKKEGQAWSPNPLEKLAF